MNNKYITKQCRNLAHNGKVPAMLFILSHYDRYMKAVAVDAIKTSFANRGGDYDVFAEDLIQEIKVNIIMNSCKLKG